MRSLQQRFENFVSTLDGFESIDALLHGAGDKAGKRADYLLQNRQVVIEQKVLRSDPAGRPQKFVEKLARERGIFIYGSVTTDRVFNCQPDPEKLQHRMVLDLARAVSDNVAYADKQTASTRTLFNIPDALGVLVLLNESVEVLRPDVIEYAIRNSFLRKSEEKDEPEYAANDGAIVISEAATITLSSSHPCIPVLICVGPKTCRSALFNAFADVFVERWADFNDASFVRGPNNIDLTKAAWSTPGVRKL